MALAGSALPELVRTRIHRPEVYRSRLQMLYDTMALLSYGIAVPMTFLHRGRQYIVVATGGGSNTSLVALALPDY